VELIADGKHLPEALLKLVYKCKGPDRICLVTDASRGAGLPEGTCTKLGAMSGGMDIVVDDGVAKLADRSSFAGSVATADRLLRTMCGVGIDLCAVSRMMSATPARVLSCSDRGSIEANKRADLVLLDEHLQVITTFLEGTQYES
jgi:N-acetylglucosamine-6-phosphate deacetylase